MKKDKFKWHKWFAWRPVLYRNDNYNLTFAWFEYIFRRRKYVYDWDEGWYSWEYRKRNIKRIIKK